jgi:tetratricopeptide (TPR) repeat protein
VLCAALAGGAWAQGQKPVEPPEEDESLIPKEYSFNPLQAEKEVRIGNFYFTKGSYNAAANRFREAIKWNEGYAEAYYRLGEVCTKMKDASGARKAYEKFLELEPNTKRAAGVRKLLARKK